MVGSNTCAYVDVELCVALKFICLIPKKQAIKSITGEAPAGGEFDKNVTIVKFDLCPRKLCSCILFQVILLAI